MINKKYLIELINGIKDKYYDMVLSHQKINNKISTSLEKNEVNNENNLMLTLSDNFFNAYDPQNDYDRDATKYHIMEGRHAEILGEFLDCTALDAEKLKECLIRGWISMCKKNKTDNQRNCERCIYLSFNSDGSAECAEDYYHRCSPETQIKYREG